MANLNLRGIPDDLYTLLKDRAAHDARSLNQQVLWLLRQGLSSTAVDPAIWKRIDKRRARQHRAGSDSVTLLRRDRGRLT